MVKTSKICCKPSKQAVREERWRHLTRMTHSIKPMLVEWRRRFGLLLLGVVCGLPFLTPGQAAATSCADVYFVFARGSGSPLAASDYQAWQSALQREVVSRLPKLRFAHYELGAQNQSGYQYPAVAVGFDSAEAALVTLGAVVDAGGTGSFQQSINQGVGELQALVTGVAQSCPNAKFILGGYSQGGMVISQALEVLPQDKILYAATFGDPQLYLPEGAPRWLERPLACSGQNLSTYRANVPDCTTYQGILGGKQPYVNGNFTQRTGAWCYQDDFMCGSRLNFSDLLGAHLSYKDTAAYTEAASKIYSRLKNLSASTDDHYTSYEPGTSPGWQPQPQPTTGDTIDYKLLIDSVFLTNVDAATITTKLETIAKLAVAPGKIRLGIYLWDETSHTMSTLFPLGSDYAEVITKISQLTAMISQGDWGNGKYFASMARAARHLVGSDPWYSRTYAQLTHVTDDYSDFDYAHGPAATSFPAEINETGITAGTKLVYTLDELILYYANAGHATSSFAATARSRASTSTSFYSTTTNPNPADTSISTYTTDANQNQASNSTLAYSVATITGIVGKLGAGTAQIQFEADQAQTVLVVVNGALLGIAEQNNFTLINLPEQSEITLIPYDAQGRRGSTRSLELSGVDGERVQSGNVGNASILVPDTGVQNPFLSWHWFPAWPGQLFGNRITLSGA